MFGLMMISDVTSKVLIKDNAMFQQKSEVAFSESSLTIITVLDLKPAEKTIKYLECSLIYYLNKINEWRANSTVQQMVSERLNSRKVPYRQDLDICKERIFIFRTSTGDFNNRKRRRLASEGGALLKWLFELPTKKRFGTKI